MIKNYLEAKLNEIFSLIMEEGQEFNWTVYQGLKSKLSAKGISDKLGINPNNLTSFEETLKQFYINKDDVKKSRISSYRLALWLEIICKNLNISFSLDETISNEEIAIKQVRALELIIRDVVNDNFGGKENVLFKLKELFKDEVIDKWIKNADESGVLSGTTFSELSSIFLDKNIFKSVEDIFESSEINLTKSSRESLRFILEDIRIIRNSIAHNKKITTVQVEALNEYYRTIAQLIKDAKSNSINPDHYLDLDKAGLESFIAGLHEDTGVIKEGINEIKTGVSEIKDDTKNIRKRSSLIAIGVLLLLISSGIIFFMMWRQSGSNEELGKDIKDVKNIVSGDAELKNMSTSEDLSVTKDLNARTKDKNAKRLAIIYFDNSGGDPSMDKLKKGLADMLISDLSNVNMLDIVERDKLEAILKEQKLSNTKEFDPSTSAKIGKLLGAEIILTGGYFEMMESIRIDARFIDVETGKILKSDGVDGNVSSFFKLQKQLSWKILKNMDTKISEEEKINLENIEKSKPLSFDDMKEYSRALDLFDSNKKEDAKKIAEKIVSKYPSFAPGIQLMNKLK